MIVSNLWWSLLATAEALLLPLFFYLGFKRHDKRAAQFFKTLRTFALTVGLTLTLVNTFATELLINAALLVVLIGSGVSIGFGYFVFGNVTKDRRWWVWGTTVYVALATTGVLVSYPAPADIAIAIAIVISAYALVWSWSVWIPSRRS